MGEGIKTRRGGGSAVSALIFYNEGEQNVAVTGGWVVGSSAGTGSQSKQTDHFYYEGIYGLGYRTYVTDQTIDFKNISNLYVEWEKTATAYEYARFYVRISDQKGGSAVASDFVASLDSGLRGVFAKEIQSVDVSGITGEYYIRVHGYSAGSASDFLFTGKIFKVWGE